MKEITKPSSAPSSVWYNDKNKIMGFPQLNSNLETDVLIVGGGIAGLSTAYCVASSGKKVIVVEDGAIGSGETGKTTAQLVTALDTRYYKMETVFGVADTALIAESHQQAITFIEDLIRREKIDCEFERLDGYLFLHPHDQQDSLLKERDALLRSGQTTALLENTPGIPTEGKSLLFPMQAQFHPMKYLLGLCKAIVEKGGQIYVNTHASVINHTGITSDKGFTISAKHIVVATNAPVNDTYAMMLKQTAFRSYVISGLVKKQILPKALWWDTGDQQNENGQPYHYVRTTAYDDDFDLLICGGEDHPVGVIGEFSENERFERLEMWTRARFPIETITHKWSGEVLIPMDSIAYLGRNPFDKKNAYIITGDAGIGMTYCTIGARIICDLINDVGNRYESLYAPSRFHLKASGPFFKTVMGDIEGILHKWFSGKGEQLDTLGLDEGKIIEIEGHRCGAYKDASGHLFLVSAECTHLKCILCWNASEKSWDCPCHGSRFSFTGEVLNGPANENLKSYDTPQACASASESMATSNSGYNRIKQIRSHLKNKR
ncbi:MAG: FAD-dependent oxidoreductase [bacterium]|nr:FAD-dependent oxidoreductase [bacterium]